MFFETTYVPSPQLSATSALEEGDGKTLHSNLFYFNNNV